MLFRNYQSDRRSPEVFDAFFSAVGKLEQRVADCVSSGM